MIEDKIAALVETHYAAPEAGLLMLSNVGARLSKDGHWPPPSQDKRTLFDIAQQVPRIALVSDPDAKAFIAVVREGDEQRARDAIVARKRRFFLRGLPRAFLIAFTLDTAPGQPMFVRLQPRVSYSARPEAEDKDHIRIDDDLRLPGLDVGDIEALGESNVDRLEANIRTWCERHGMVAEEIGGRQKPIASSRPAAAQGHSALERLFAAQDPEVAKRMSLPFDIALALSRLP